MATPIIDINIGTSPNDKTGDKIRDGGQIINDNNKKLKNLTSKIEFGNLQVYKYPGNIDITIFVEQKDVVEGIIEAGGLKYKIEAQYNTGDISDFGTAAGFFNDGSYNTSDFRQLL